MWCKPEQCHATRSLALNRKYPHERMQEKRAAHFGEVGCLLVFDIVSVTTTAGNKERQTDRKKETAQGASKTKIDVKVRVRPWQQ